MSLWRELLVRSLKTDVEHCANRVGRPKLRDLAMTSAGIDRYSAGSASQSTLPRSPRLAIHPSRVGAPTYVTHDRGRSLACIRAPQARAARRSWAGTHTQLGTCSWVGAPTNNKLVSSGGLPQIQRAKT